MSIRPAIRGLMLCERVVVEEATRNVSAINCFTRRNVERLPSPPLEFDVFALLAGGHGTVKMTFRLSRPDTMAPILIANVSLNFAGPLQEVRFILRKIRCVFPVAGTYQADLLADGEPIALTTFEIRRRVSDHA